MKKLFLATLATVLVLALSASGQVPSKPFNIYVGGGLSMPMGDFSDGYSTGFHGTARVGFSAAPKVEVMAGIDYHSNKWKDESRAAFKALLEAIVGPIGTIEGGNSQMFLVAADAKLSLGVPMAPVNPYVFGGLGLASVGVSAITIDDVKGSSASESKVYFELGGGAEFNKFFLQGKLITIPGALTDGTNESAANMLAFSAGLKL